MIKRPPLSLADTGEFSSADDQVSLASEEESAQAARILIVDDDPQIQAVLEALLSVDGYGLAFASNGPEALRMLQHDVPDVVLLDILMPGMNGFAVCRQIRAMPQFADIPVLMLTALDDRQSRLRGIESGCDDFLTKPFDQVELRARLRSITRLNRYRRLLAERQRLSWMLEHSSDGYLMLDDDADITYANQRARKYLGLRETGATARLGSFFSQVKQYTRQPADAWQNWPHQTDERPRYLVYPETATNEAFWLEVRTPMVDAGARAQTLVQLTDVTAIVAAQLDMRRLLRTVSHKLRTPLNHIMGPAELLAGESRDTPPEVVDEMARIILHGARELTENIDKLLRLWEAPTQARGEVQAVQLAQLPELARGVAAHLEILPVAVSVPSEIADLRIGLTAHAVELVLTELLENSKKFHPAQHPAITVEVSRFGADQIRVSVCDDGVWLSPAQLAAAWGPLYQAEKFMTGEVRGMGLGLPLVATIVWNAGGQATLHNRPENPGVCVELLLPLGNASEPQP